MKIEIQRMLRSAPITIIVDDREPGIIRKFLAEKCKVRILRLSIGDYICSERVGIERKTYDDFISSIIDGRIFEQAFVLKEAFEKPILILEGYSSREINENSLKGAVASLLVDYGLSLVQTKNPLDTAKTIYWIAKKEQEEEKSIISFRIKKKKENIKDFQEMIVASLPGVSRVLSKRLLKHFRTVERIFCARESQLKKVKGIGEKLARKIRRIVTYPYGD